MQMFAPTAVTWGRVRIEHPDRVVDQHFEAPKWVAGGVRLRVSGWQQSVDRCLDDELSFAVRPGENHHKPVGIANPNLLVLGLLIDVWFFNNLRVQ